MDWIQVFVMSCILGLGFLDPHLMIDGRSSRDQAKKLKTFKVFAQVLFIIISLTKANYMAKPQIIWTGMYFASLTLVRGRTIIT